ncbi:uncharacterized protein LOC110736515 [Chenopodium quinoa]|uniref:uncharacterized protein LOC110736515 n=1 Tax=Chenopodium quinoa TaxID=63459 RepID=UPI000B77AACF|nr:uncharacterized protein LOC110736515 [Chenopodium quinoa]
MLFCSENMESSRKKKKKNTHIQSDARKFVQIHLLGWRAPYLQSQVAGFDMNWPLLIRGGRMGEHCSQIVSKITCDCEYLSQLVVFIVTSILGLRLTNVNRLNIDPKLLLAKKQMSLPCKRNSDGSEKVLEEEKARGCLMKIADYKQKYALLEDGEFGSQKVSLTGRITNKEDYSDESHFLMHEEGLEVLLVAMKRYCQNVGLVELGHDVRVTGSPGKSKGKLCLYADSFSILPPCLLNLEEKGVSVSNIEEPKHHKHFEKLSNHQFQWKVYNGVKILQPPIKQGPNMCAFAAVVKQLDYNLRLLYANASKGLSLTEDECIFDHKKWENDLKKEYPDRKTRWKPIDLLVEAQTRGVPLWNHGTHVIQYAKGMSCHKIDAISRLKQLLKFFPVIGVVPVYTTYNVDGDDLYVRGGSYVTERKFDREGMEVEQRARHAVVLVDLCEIDGISYISYQNSEGDSGKSMCELGISWMEADLIGEIVYGCSLPPVHPPSVLQTKNQIDSMLAEFEMVGTSLSASQEYFREGQNVIYQITESRLVFHNDERMSLDKKIQDYITRLHDISQKLKKFFQKYKNVQKAAVAGFGNVPRLLEACGDADEIEGFATKLQQLHQNTLL